MPDEAASADSRFSEEFGERFVAWLKNAPDCGEAPTPLLLVAAEGGGARAAYWTVKAMEVLHDDACLGPALFVASGVSGGSVGLAVDQVVPSREAVEEITDLTEPYPLARGITGFLAGDYVAAITGVRVAGENGGWLDRAGHLEDAWEQQVTALGGSFTQDADEDDPFLILNTADSVSGCRITVTQLPVDGALAWTGKERVTSDDCGNPSTGAGYTLEFDEVWTECAQNLRWSTAAMLSARFPFVTPGGRMPVPVPAIQSPSPDGDSAVQGCGGIEIEKAYSPQAQLVDGGYSDGSGLGTLADLMPEVTDRVVGLNACIAAQPERSAEDTITAACGFASQVMPIVVYIKNDRGFEVDAEMERLAAEFLVPLAGAKAKGLQNSEEAWLQRLADDLAEIGVPKECQYSAVCDQPVVVVSATTTPTIAPPLGWTLSRLSRQTLDAALAESEQRCGTVDDYPTLAELRALAANAVCAQK